MQRFARILKGTQHFRVFASMPHLSFRNFCLVAATFLVALQMAPCGTPAAHAGCGDYVHVGKGADSAGTAGDETGLARVPAQRERLPLPQPSPCHGPSCRQNPVAPCAPAPVLPSNGGEHKACLPVLAVNLVVSHKPVTPDPLVVVGESPAGRIERPPRHSS
jgi:hypothetical protein